MSKLTLPLIADGESPFSKEWLGDQDPNASSVFVTGIPMRDGAELAADVYLPKPSELPAPVIVQVTPYGRGGIGHDHSEAKYYQEKGYVFVSVDCRGRGASEGEWQAFVNDAQDTHDVIEWSGAQDWSTGKVGTTGLSYSGWVQWAAASERPQHLVCMVSTSAAGAWMQEVPFTYGAFQGYFLWWLLLVRRRVLEMNALRTMDINEVLSTLPLSRVGEIINGYPVNWETVVQREEFDEFWKQLRFDDRYQDMNVPCLHVTGWYDLEDLNGAMHHYEGMINASPAADQQQLIVGPWSHVQSRHPDHRYADVSFEGAATVDMDAVHLRWFDHWLKGIDNGVANDPRVRVFEPGANRWREAERWPLPGKRHTLFLRNQDGTRSLADTRPISDDPTVGFRYDPLDPVPTGMDVSRYPLEDPPLEQTENEKRDDVVYYTSAPLESELVLSGRPVLRFRGSSTGTDTDWHVKLTDVDPTGRSFKVCQGVLRAAFQDSLETAVALEPEEEYEFEVNLWPTQYAFRAGHSIRVSITSSDFPWFVRNLNTFGPIEHQSEAVVVTNRVHHRASNPSVLELPVSTVDIR